MKLSIELKADSPKEWIEAVMNDFESFLQDHADCERKASAMAMSFVAKCPDKTEIIPELIDTALEELEHFKQVYEVMHQRGLSLRTGMHPDDYVNKLIGYCRSGVDDRLLDRFCIASIVECRGAERFRLVEEALPDGELKRFYKNLWANEAKHGHIFVKMALLYYPENQVYERLHFLGEKEAEVMLSLPIKSALH